VKDQLHALAILLLDMKPHQTEGRMGFTTYLDVVTKSLLALSELDPKF